ncbi:hypothetical protein CLOAM1204 [Candidatus Cloacimonas acidaminovorans str. Evry]|jgi:hypothetical protein|uniref:Uncharacterized protein n=1 Tax=Cloacimonas acidaminovorans (strain Evry) TaxID=459349 RepID=B0VEV6_CLOAI|nr:hypothetical protein CLOAM1204 [Candidatus Cloacimonas acidaminovorans str. Evry]
MKELRREELIGGAGGYIPLLKFFFQMKTYPDNIEKLIIRCLFISF